MVWTQQDKPYLAFPLLHCQHQVILDLLLAVLTGAVEVILLLQLLPPLLAHVEEIHVGNGQLVPRRYLAQCPQLDPGCKGDDVWSWRSNRSEGAATEPAETKPATCPCLAGVSPYSSGRQMQRWAAAWLTEYRAKLQSHQFLLPLCKSLAGTRKGLSDKHITTRLFDLDGGRM